MVDFKNITPTERRELDELIDKVAEESFFVNGGIVFDYRKPISELVYCDKEADFGTLKVIQTDGTVESRPGFNTPMILSEEERV